MIRLILCSHHLKHIIVILFELYSIILICFIVYFFFNIFDLIHQTDAED